MAHTYGAVTINNGTMFRARKDGETGKVSYMTHRGAQNASVKIAKSFIAGGDTAVSPSNRYLFPDEYLNASMSQANSNNAKWKKH